MEVAPESEALTPRVVVVVVVLTSTSGALGEGGIIPSVSVETYVAVDPEMTMTVELVYTPPLGAGKLGVATAPVVGGMIPALPVDVAVAVEKNVVISPLPLVVVAGT